MRIGDKKRIFIFLSSLLLQSDAEIQCSKGFKGSVGSPGNSDSFEDASEVSDVACDDGQMCAMFEVEEMDQESKTGKYTVHVYVI